MKLRWTTRRLEAVGFVLMVVGIGWIYIPAGLIVAGIWILASAYVGAEKNG